jgi:general L-amino acid transport system substrate-binding protein
VPANSASIEDIIMRKSTLKIIAASSLALAGSMLAANAQAGKTLDAIKQRDQVVCGVNTGLAGFSAADSQGNWVGLDVDICKAIAAAVATGAHWPNPMENRHG